MLFPALPHSAQAVEGDTGVSTYADTPTVSINVPSTINFTTITPTAAGTTTTATANLTVATTNSAGYNLYLYSSDGNNSLTSINPANTSTIDAINNGGVGLTLSSLEPNTWGYNLGATTPSTNTTYIAVPTINTTPIQTKDTSSTNSANDTYTLSFGAKVDTTIASGTYTNSLTVAVVADPPLITAFDGITYMQEMTSTICTNAEENETARLTDSRDQKQYWVTKLADGNCWMTQNLDLDLNSTTLPLTPATSDVSSNWSPDVYTDPQGKITSNSSLTGTYSWDVGMYVNKNPASYTSCSNTTNINTCSNWTDVSTMTAMTEENTSGNVISGNTYDAHYLAGNYYQWNTATAGTGGTITSQDAKDSICPKGWHLPTSNNTDSGSFAYLMNKYSITSNTASTTAITQSPLYFNPSGYVNSGSLWLPGSLGRCWSSTAYSNTNYAYNLRFISGHVSPSDDFARFYGFSVRCLADGNTTTGGGDSSDNS